MDSHGTPHGGSGEDPDVERQVAEFRELLSSADPAQLAALMAQLLDGPHPSRRRPPRADVVTYVLRVVLDDVEPPVWRQLEVVSDVRLDRLDHILQAAIGWTESHLHGFAVGDSWQDPFLERYPTAFDLSEGDEGVPEADVRLDEVLADVGDRLLYTYDFGDGWDHAITLERVLSRADDAPVARCTGGGRACPPEDCGGSSGYEELLGLMAAAQAGRPLSEEDQEQLEWYSADADPAAMLAAVQAFDVTEADAAVRLALADGGPGGVGRGTRGWGGRGPDADPWPAAMAELAHRAAGPWAGVLVEMLEGAGLDRPVLVDVDVATRMVAPFQWIVRHVGASGVALTGAGYLRPADVQAVAVALDLGREWIGTLNREHLTAPVLVFRQACQAAGLLRLAKGRLTATRRALGLVDDPVRLWWYLAGRLPLGRRGMDRDAGMAVLLAAASGGAGPERAAAWRGAASESSESSGSSGWRPGPHATPDEPVAAALHALGWAVKDGSVIPGWQVRRMAELTVAVLERLGVHGPRDLGAREPQATPEGEVFARAALRTWP